MFGLRSPGLVKVILVVFIIITTVMILMIMVMKKECGLMKSGVCLIFLWCVRLRYPLGFCLTWSSNMGRGWWDVEKCTAPMLVRQLIHMFLHPQRHLDDQEVYQNYVAVKPESINQSINVKPESIYHSSWHWGSLILTMIVWIEIEGEPVLDVGRTCDSFIDSLGQPIFPVSPW